MNTFVTNVIHAMFLNVGKDIIFQKKFRFDLLESTEEVIQKEWFPTAPALKP